MSIQDKKDLAIKLRKYRENCGLSQKAVAEALNMERSGYTVYETGRSQPPIHNLIKIAELFNIDPSVLLTNEKPDSLKDNATESNMPIYSLKKDEQQLILYYRILSDKDKEDILAKITKKVKDNK